VVLQQAASSQKHHQEAQNSRMMLSAALVALCSIRQPRVNVWGVFMQHLYTDANLKPG